MKVWMTIGYSDYEGNDNINKVFSDKDKAVDHILKFVFDCWRSDDGKLFGDVDYDTFYSNCKDYIMNKPNVGYWEFREGSKWLCELFDYWEDDCALWFGLKEVELQ